MKDINNTIEQLVTLKAQIAALQKQTKAIEAEFKLQGENVWEGFYHTVRVAQVDSNPVNWKALAADLQPSEYYIKKHTGYKSTLRLTINVKKKEAA